MTTADPRDLGHVDGDVQVDGADPRLGERSGAHTVGGGGCRVVRDGSSWR
jgi:hypothetical protein